MIEKARFGDRLTVTLRVAPEVLPVVVPFLCLQPLVENAVRHGLALLTPVFFLLIALATRSVGAGVAGAAVTGGVGRLGNVELSDWVEPLSGEYALYLT